MTARERLIFLDVGRHGFLSRGHVQALHFPTHKSQTSCDRALERLREQGLIQVVGRRMIPGTGRGSGQYVYRLGERGKKFYPGKYRAARLPDMEHMIATVEAFITVQQLEQAGTHKVIAMYPEPDTWTVIEDIELRPDLYVELQDVATGQTGVWWIEIDMNNEGRADITKKVQDYIKAKDLSGEYEETDPQGHVTRIQVGPETFPLVLFLVPEQQRQTFIQRIVDQHHDKAGAKFEVEIFSKFQEWVLQSIAV